jgi:hypothetical protein
MKANTYCSDDLSHASDCTRAQKVRSLRVDQQNQNSPRELLYPSFSWYWQDQLCNVDIKATHNGEDDHELGELVIVRCFSSVPIREKQAEVQTRHRKFTWNGVYLQTFKIS